MKSAQSSPFTPEGESRRIENFSSSGSSVLIVAKLGEQVVGLGIGSRKNADPRMIHRFEVALSVQKAHGNKGIGTEILKCLIDFAKFCNF